jgi:hypothetical protein
MFNFFAHLYWCLLVVPDDRLRVINFLIGGAMSGLTEGIPYRLWTFERGALCLAFPLTKHDQVYSPERRASTCFHPVASNVADHASLSIVQGHEEKIRQFAYAREIVLPEALLLYVSDRKGETILSLQCEDHSPSFDQSIRLVRVVKDEGWAWQAVSLHHAQSAEPSTFPKFAWKNVAPLTPPLLSAWQEESKARAGHIIAVKLEDATEALGWVERSDGCDAGTDLIRVVWLRRTGTYTQAWYTHHLGGKARPYESSLPAVPDPGFVWHGIMRFGDFRILHKDEIGLLILEQVAGPDIHGTMQRSVMHAYGCTVAVG